MSSSQIPGVSLQQLVEQDKGPIWVINTSAEVMPPTGGDVFVTFVINNQPIAHEIPKTWLPSSLTDRFPRKAILESSYFIDALTKGLLKAITPEAALALLSSPNADRERKRLKHIQEAISAATQARGIGKNVSITASSNDLDDDDEDNTAPKTRIQGLSNGVQGNNDNDDTAAPIGTSRNVARAVSLMGDDEDENGESIPKPDPISANFRAWVIQINMIVDPVDAKNEARLRGDMSVVEAEYLMRNTKHENISISIAKSLKKIAAAAPA